MAQYEGIETVYMDGRTTGTIPVPENIPHYYINGHLKVLAVGYDSRGRIPPDPPDEFKAPNFQRARDLNWPEPRAAYRPDGSVASSGWIPGDPVPVWVDATPGDGPSAKDLEAKALAAALEDPATLVSKAGVDNTVEFVAEVSAALKRYVTKAG